MKIKVMCGTCVNYVSNTCSIKKIAVKAKKKRVCDKYVHDESKEHKKQPIPSTKRPDWFWLTRSEKKKLIKSVLERAKETPEKKDEKHPMTGDLSRFTTTASTEEE